MPARERDAVPAARTKRRCPTTTTSPHSAGSPAEDLDVTARRDVRVDRQGTRPYDRHGWQHPWTASRHSDQQVTLVACMKHDVEVLIKVW
jgi:hypothetical protein